MDPSDWHDQVVPAGIIATSPARTLPAKSLLPKRALRLKRCAQIQHQAVIVGRWYHQFIQAVTQLYYANVLPGVGITGNYHRFRIQQCNVPNLS